MSRRRGARRPGRAAVLLLAVALAATHPAAAGGFQVFQQGAKASGQGGAFTAGVDDASAVYYNPAAVAHLEGWNLSLGLSAVRTDTVFSPPFQLRRDPTTMQGVVAYPRTIYIAGRLSDNYGIALGSWVPYSLKTHWWATDPVATSSLKASWTSREYNASIAAVMGPAWSIALGAEVVRLRIDDLSRVEGSRQSNVRMDGRKAGANLALHYRAPEGRLRFGLSVRTAKTVRLEGERKLETDAGGPPLSVTPVEATVTLPATFQMGVGEDGRGRWDWELNLQYARWAGFDRSLLIRQHEDWSNTISFFGGFEYHFNAHHSGRGGVIVDPTPIPEESTRPYNPDADKVALTAGYGWKGAEGRIQVDAFGQLFVYQEQSPSGNPSADIPAGSYDTRAYAFGASFQYRF